MADLKTTNIYGDAYINNKVGINTNTPATRLQIGQLSPTAATEGLQFGDDTGARIYRSAASTISIAGNFNASSGTITSTYGGFSSPGLILGDAQYGFYVASGNLYYKSAAGGNHYWRNIANNATTLALDNSGNLTALGNISAANLSGTNTGDQTVGNGTITIAAGTGIGVGTSNTFTTNQSGATTVTVTNNGVTSNVAGTGISVSGATGAVTITNSGVTSVAGTTNQVSVSAGTGAVTFSLPQNIHTAATPTFASITTSTDGANITMAGSANAEGIRMTAASSATYPVFLRSLNPGSGGESSPWIYKEAATDWGIWHNNPVNSIDFTKQGSGGIANNVGGSSTNTVTVRVEMATGFVQTIAGYRNSAGTTILDNNGNISGNAATVTNGLYTTSNFLLGTTTIALNRTSSAQTLTGISIDGNAGTATVLATGRAINGVSFNGSAAITVDGLNYSVNNEWFRENGDDAQFKMYGNSRTMIYRTDGNTNAHGGGGYAHIFYYGGSADNQRMFIINTDGRLWSNYHGWLDAMSITGNSGNVSINNLNTQQVSVGLTAGSWYTIAANSGDRASAKFTITDSTSGLHQAVHFYATAHFGNANGAKITVVSNTYYGGPPFGNIRIMTGGTYDGAMVQVYINTNCTINVSIYDNQQVSGWIIKSGVVSTTNPGTVAAFASLTTNSSQVDLNSGKSFSVTDDIYIGGTTTQYKALHAGNYNSYAPSLTGANASGTWSVNITGNAATATTATSADNIDGRPFVNTNSNSATNADTINSNGISYYTGGVTNFSGNATDGALYSQAYSNDWQHQIAGDYRSGQIALRGKNSGTWQSWRTVLDSTNYSSYAGGLSTGNTFTNINVFNSPNNTTIGGLSGNYGLTVYQGTAGTDAYMTFHVGGDFAGYFGLGGAENDLVWGGWSVGNFRYRILHSSNAPYAWNMNQYVRTTDNVTFGTVTATLSGTATNAGAINSDTGNVGGSRLQYWQTSGNTALNPDGEWYNAIRMGHGDPVTYYSNTLAVRMTGGNLGDIYTRTTTNGVTGSWNRFWHNNNDGASSGLDADLLDGNHASAFALVAGSSGQNFSANAIYPYEWIRFMTDAGIYWNTGTYAGHHIYPQASWGMSFRSQNNGDCGLQLRGNNNTSLGAVYSDGTSIGFLTAAFGWGASFTLAGSMNRGTVPLARIETITAYTILGNNNVSGAAVPAALSVAQVATMLSGQTMNIAGSSTSCTGNAATATTATNATVNSGNTSAAWYPVVWHSGNTLYSSAGVQIYANGNYLQANYFNSSDDVSTGNISYIMAKFGDGYLRSATAAKVAAFISNQTMSIQGSSTSCSGNAATVTNGVYTTGAQSISGVKTFSDPPVAVNIAKAWVHFNGTGTVAINTSYNVSSITDNGVGDYTVNFTSAFVDANYVVAGTSNLDYTNNSSNYNVYLSVPRQTNAQQAGSCRLATEYPAGVGLYDCVAVRAVFFR